MAVNGRKTVLLHFDSSESEKRNQLALIESQLFFDTVQNEETGEVTVPMNKLPNEVRFYCNRFDGDQGNRASTGSCSSAAPLKKVVIVFWPQRESAHSIKRQDCSCVPSWTTMTKMCHSSQIRKLLHVDGHLGQ